MDNLSIVNNELKYKEKKFTNQSNIKDILNFFEINKFLLNFKMFKNNIETLNTFLTEIYKIDDITLFYKNLFSPELNIKNNGDYENIKFMIEAFKGINAEIVKYAGLKNSEYVTKTLELTKPKIFHEKEDEELKKSFNITKTKNTKTLTSVNLTDDLVGSVINTLGVKNDIGELFSKSEELPKLIKYVIYKLMPIAGESINNIKKALKNGTSFISDVKLKISKIVGENDIPNLLNEMEQIILKKDKKDKDISDLAAKLILFKIDNVELMKLKSKGDIIYSKLLEIIKIEETLLKTKNKSTIESKLKEIDEIKQNIFKREKEEKTLKKWQIKAVNYIVNGDSILVNGPTGGGKTYVSTIAFNLSVKSKKITVYIAPTHYLTFQTYCNFIKTFEETPVPCSFISPVFSKISKDSVFYFGTPLELWNYFNSNNIDFDIGIFDEIHTLSTNFGEGKLDLLTSEAISNLLGKCNKQVIALSATISEIGITILKNYISERSKIPNIYEVLYRKRTVELQRYIYDKNGINKIDNSAFLNEEKEVDEVNEIIMSDKIKISSDTLLFNHNDDELPITNIYDTNNNLIPADNSSTPDSMEDIKNLTYVINEENTFNLLSHLQNKSLLPGIIFDDTENKCFEYFEKYVTWVEKEEKINMPSWYELQSKLENEISNYNELRSNPVNNYLSATGEKALNEALSRLNPVIKKKSEVVEKVLDIIKKELIDKLKLQKHDEKYLIKLNDLTKKSIKELANIEVDYLSYNNYAIYEEYVNFRNSSSMKVESDTYSELSYPFRGVSRFFRIGGELRALTDFRNIYVTDNESSKQQTKAVADKLCKAENLDLQKVKELHKLILKGLEYGVTILIPTLPFVFQYFLIKALTETSNKNPNAIKCIFVSHSMAMGINYAFRSVIIRSSFYSFINVPKFRQMEGRCGRQGLDTEGHVISWNISNANETTLNNLPNILTPNFGNDRGCLIPDYLSLAIEITKKINEKYSFIDSICVALGYEEFIYLGIKYRITNFSENNITDEMRIDPYFWISKVNDIKFVLQELYVRLSNCNNELFLKYISKQYEDLNKFQFMFLKL